MLEQNLDRKGSLSRERKEEDILGKRNPMCIHVGAKKVYQRKLDM